MGIHVDWYQDAARLSRPNGIRCIPIQFSLYHIVGMVLIAKTTNAIQLRGALFYGTAGDFVVWA